MKLKTSILWFFSIFSLMITTVARIGFALLLSSLITALEAANKELFIQTILLMIVCFTVECAFTFLANHLTNYYVKLHMVALKEYTFFKDMQKKSDIDITTYSSKTSLFASSYFLNKINIAFYAIQILLSSIIYIWINPILFIYLIVVTGLMLLIPLISQKGLQKATGNYTTKSNEYINYLMNLFAGKGEIKQYGVLNFFLKNHAKKNQALEQSYYQYNIKGYNAQLISSTFSMVSFGGLIVISGFLVLNGKMALGLLLTVIQLMNYFIGPLVQMIQSINQYNAVKKEVPLIQAEEVILEKETVAFHEKIVIADLSHTYAEGQPIHYPKQLVFEKNKKYAICGKSGSGKSTLAQILSGNLDVLQGEVYLDEQKLELEQQKAFFQKIIYVPQNGHLFYDSVKENVLLYRDEFLNQIPAALDFCNLECTDEFLEKSIDETTQISSGEKARLVLARAMLATPQILIVDEPTANLDYQNAVSIITKLCKLENLTMIVITHETDESILSNFDSIITL